MNSISLYADGSCSNNPGPGGWGAVLLYQNKARKISGFEPSTTNNRMELMATIKGLELLTRPCVVTIYTDSRYVQEAFAKNWIRGWQTNGWKTANKSPVKNQDLWLELINLTKRHSVTWIWVKGHAGNTYNEICDVMAKEAIINKNGIDITFTI